jgi:hypothetical protein
MKLTCIKHDMAGSDHASAAKIQTPIPTMIHRIPKKDTWSRSVAEFMNSSGRLIGEAKASKHPKMTVIWGGAEQKLQGGE